MVLWTYSNLPGRRRNSTRLSSRLKLIRLSSICFIDDLGWRLLDAPAEISVVETLTIGILEALSGH
jgi:hypothetical protein